MKPSKRKIEKYCRDHSSTINSVLTSLEMQTALYSTTPQMLSGKLVGVLLNILIANGEKKTILEIGSFTGYSTLSMAANNPTAQIYSLEINEERHQKLLELKENTKSLSNVSFINLNAVDWLSTINKTFDLVFIDATKRQYLKYLSLLLPKMKANSLIIADNMLWYDQVIHKSKDQETNIIDIYNKLLCLEPNIDSVLLPISDGLMISRIK